MPYASIYFVVVPVPTSRSLPPCVLDILRVSFAHAAYRLAGTIIDLVSLFKAPVR